MLFMPDLSLRRGLIAFAGLLALAGPLSSVQAQGWIAGVGIGAAAQQKYVVDGPVESYDDQDAAYRVFGAFMVSPNMGVVASYVDLGETHYDGPQTSYFSDKFEVTGIDVSYLFRWTPGSQERLSLFGTAGLFVWDQMVTREENSSIVDFSDDGSSFSLGLGADISLGSGGSGRWGIHVEYQLYKNVGDDNNSRHQYDRDILTAGISYRFGNWNRYQR